MKILKKVLLLALCIVTACMCLAGCGGGEEGSDGGSKTIAVVAKGESHAFWQSVKAGRRS